MKNLLVLFQLFDRNTKFRLLFVFIAIFVGSLFGKGNGTTLAVIIFFVLGLFVARKSKSFFLNSRVSNYF